jgi:hypothetical protein
VTHGATPASVPAHDTPYTVVGVFEDSLDAREGVHALRKAGCPAEAVSILLRDRAPLDDGKSIQRNGIAQVMETADLDDHGGWLIGLITIVVPEPGAYLTAGPIGAMLEGMNARERDDVPDDEPLPPPDRYEPPTHVQVLATLLEFGFGQDEAEYIDRRLDSGSIVLAVTSADRELLQTTRRLFAQNNAVHLGMARTPNDVAQRAADLLVEPPELTRSPEVVVADAVAYLLRLCTNGMQTDLARLCGMRVLDRDGDELGTIEELLAEEDPDQASDTLHIRYAVISHGGLFGLGRRKSAIPADYLIVEDDAARLDIDRDHLDDAPGFDEQQPFSRRDERAICVYFGVQPYWPDDGGGASSTG